MAINLVEEPSTTAPIDSDDWSAMYNNMMAGAVPLGSILTDWTSTSAAPSLGQGGFIRYEGNLYQVQDEDEAISGSVSSGLNYIVMTLSGTTLTAAWATDKSDYSWDPAYGGMYNSDDVRDMLLPDMCYLSSSTYYRGYSVAAGNKAYVMGNGSIVTTNQLSSNSLYVSGDGTIGGDVTIDGELEPTELTSTGYETLSSSGGTWTIPRGVYTLTWDTDNTEYIQAYDEAYEEWVILYGSAPGMVISDGTHYRVRNGESTSKVVHWRKH